MNIFKKIYIRIFGEKKKEEKQPECWYNNAHEEGEAKKGAIPMDAAGSPNSYEAALTKSYVIHH